MNEDAIDRKLVWAFIDGLISDDGERKKGLEYIRSMPPVNPQPCEDAISRQAVLDIINFEDKWLLDAKGHTTNTEIAFSGMKSKVSALPFVNPQELDKIRAEIKAKYDSIPWRNTDYDDGWIEALEWALDDVLDKYKAERTNT